MHKGALEYERYGGFKYIDIDGIFIMYLVDKGIGIDVAVVKSTRMKEYIFSLILSVIQF